MQTNNVRTATVLISWQGELLGQVGPFTTESPYWAQVGEVAGQASRLAGAPVAVLRMLSVDGGEGGRAGAVRYLAEALERPTPSLAPVVGAPAGDHPLRLPWAAADGLRAEWAWAERELAALGRPVTGPVEQVRSWNLSAVSRIPTAAGPVWLKSTPPFAVAEAAAIALVAAVDPSVVPSVLASDGRRMLIDQLPGTDCWGVPDDAMIDVVDRWASAQAALAADGPDGWDDRSPAALAARFPALVDRLDELTEEERAAARELAGRLPALAAELDACGLPLTLVHGDFHPGNWRFDGARTTALDFSDALWGHPALDGLRPAGFLPEARWQQLRERWIAAWSALVPGSDPARALDLAVPFFHVHCALRYQEFLDGIEPSEHPYHAGDPAAEVRQALRSA
ncbi:phosphotransferase [Kitasatospora sp. NPDC049285]|uniref:phosphotransferase family protein n=1 Tax=Kitasatospora sp. NPDC049285 TaxID=3157096 RepID=UPI00342DF706